MFAARDQENRVFGHSVGGAAGKLHALGPKTPLKVPLKDAGGGGGGTATAKRPLGGRANGGGNENVQTVAGKSSLVTPMEPRTQRAPLGNKTTNAKALTVRPQHHNLPPPKSGRAGVKDIVRELERTAQQQQTATAKKPPVAPGSTRRARGLTPRSNAAKLSVLSDATAAAAAAQNDRERDIEYAPPPVPAQPYESDVFPDGVLTFAAFRPENRLRGYYDHYYNPVDDDGVPLSEKALAEQQRRAFEKLDLRVQADVDAIDWSIGDVPASKSLLFHKSKQQQQQPPAKPATKAVPLPTLAARRAAAALAPVSKATTATTTTAATTATAATTTTRPASGAWSGLPLRKQRPAPSALPLRPKGNAHHPVAEAASRTTLGYTKGRNVSSVVRGSGPDKTKTATVAKASKVAGAGHLDLTLAGPAASAPAGDDLAEPRSPAFLSIFDVAGDDQQSDWGGASTVVNDDDLDDGFQMEVNF